MKIKLFVIYITQIQSNLYFDENSTIELVSEKNNPYKSICYIILIRIMYIMLNNKLIMQV